jgi:hypothetical protein
MHSSLVWTGSTNITDVVMTSRTLHDEQGTNALVGHALQGIEDRVVRPDRMDDGVALGFENVGNSGHSDLPLETMDRHMRVSGHMGLYGQAIQAA